MKTQNETRKWTTILTLFGIRDVSEHKLIQNRLSSEIHVDTTDSGGRTLLMEAVIRKDHDLIKLLIRHNADVAIRDKREWTALHFAAQNYDYIATELLLDAGAKVNAKDSFGNNVISRAVFDARGGFDLLKLLLSRGALPDEKNHNGISAMDLALRIDDPDLIDILMTTK